MVFSGFWLYIYMYRYIDQACSRVWDVGLHNESNEFLGMYNESSFCESCMKMC